MEGRRKDGHSSHPRGSWQKGLPAGFASRESMQARRTEQSSGSTVKPSTVQTPKGRRHTNVREVEKSPKQGDQRPFTKDKASVVPIKDNTKVLTKDKDRTSVRLGQNRDIPSSQGGARARDIAGATMHTEVSDPNVKLEKGKTYRVPTRGATDRHVSTKYDVDAASGKSPARTTNIKVEPPHENHNLGEIKMEPGCNDNDSKDIQRRSQTNGGTDSASRIISSAKTSHSVSSAISLPAPKKESLPPNALHVMIMNANGGSDKAEAQADRRKQVIQTVIVKTMPDIILFQEFKWVGIRPSTWAKYPIPDHYVYKGHQEASILYDGTIIQVHDLPASDIDSTLRALQNSTNNRLKQRFPLDFTPVPRMCMTQVTSTKSSAIHFILISWHGRSNKSRQDGHGRLAQPVKVEYFKYLMEFIRHLKEKFKLPLLIAGDFNVDMHSIDDLVQPPFKLCMYDASMRRTVKGILDFFIISEELDASDFSWFDLERNTKVFHPNEVLDHDPVSATIRCVPVSKGKSKFSNPNDWVSARTRSKQT